MTKSMMDLKVIPSMNHCRGALFWRNWRSSHTLQWQKKARLRSKWSQQWSGARGQSFGESKKNSEIGRNFWISMVSWQKMCDNTQNVLLNWPMNGCIPVREMKTDMWKLQWIMVLMIDSTLEGHSEQQHSRGDLWISQIWQSSMQQKCKRVLSEDDMVKFSTVSVFNGTENVLHSG